MVLNVLEILNFYGAAISGVATILLFGVTGGLVLVARRQYKTSRAQLRAYVFVESAELRDLNVGETPSAIISVKNFGETPAYKVKQWSALGYHDYPLTAPIPKNEKDEINPERPLAPSDHFTVQATVKFVMNAETLKTLENKGRALFIVGEIFYEDVFHYQRWTRYCLFCGGPQGIRGGAFSAYEKYNEADYGDQQPEPFQ
jgi:hypothetical protein